MKFALTDSCSDARVDWIRGRGVAFGSPVIGILGQAKIRSRSGKVAGYVMSTLIKSPPSGFFCQTSTKCLCMTKCTLKASNDLQELQGHT